jgi:hypothetical protein
VLKIDLLPARVLRARSNRVTLVLLALVLVCVVAGLAFVYLGAKQKVGKANEELAKVTTLAQEVDKITAETSTIAGRLKPIADKIAFIAQADECGYPYWDRFYEVNEYIYGQAQVLAFAIAADKAPAGPVGDGTPEALYNLSGPGGSTDCGFLVYMKDGRDLARFILNMIRCPVLSDIRFMSFSGGGGAASFDVGQGLAIRQDMVSLAPPTTSGGGQAAPGAAGAGARAGAGPGAMGGAPPGGGVGGPGGMGGGMAGGPAAMAGGAAGAMGAGMGGGMAGGMPGGMPGGGMGAGAPGGMMGGPGGAAGGGRGAAAATGGATYSVSLPRPQPQLLRPIVLAVTGKLARPIRVPQPPAGGGGAAAGGGAAGGMGGGMMGGMGGGMGAPGGMSGGMPGGVAGPGAPGGSAGGGGAAKADAGGKKGGSDTGSKAGKKGDGGGED